MITFGSFGKISKPKSVVKNILPQGQLQQWSREEVKKGPAERLEKSSVKKKRLRAIKGRQGWAGLG